jgi:hypothetical protein
VSSQTSAQQIHNVTQGFPVAPVRRGAGATEAAAWLAKAIAKRPAPLASPLVLMSLGMAGCASTSNVSPSKEAGVVVDGYIKGATLFRDLNNNGKLDAGEPTAVTGSDGKYSLDGTGGKIVVLPAGTLVNGVATGGVDISTNAALQKVLSAPAGATVVNPLTTIVAAKVSATATAADIAAAEAQVAAADELLQLDKHHAALCAALESKAQSAHVASPPQPMRSEPSAKPRLAIKGGGSTAEVSLLQSTLAPLHVPFPPLH